MCQLTSNRPSNSLCIEHFCTPTAKSYQFSASNLKRIPHLFNPFNHFLAIHFLYHCVTCLLILVGKIGIKESWWPWPALKNNQVY